MATNDNQIRRDLVCHLLDFAGRFTMHKKYAISRYLQVSLVQKLPYFERLVILQSLRMGIIDIPHGLHVDIMQPIGHYVYNVEMIQLVGTGFLYTTKQGFRQRAEIDCEQEFPEMGQGFHPQIEALVGYEALLLHA